MKANAIALATLMLAVMVGCGGEVEAPKHATFEAKPGPLRVDGYFLGELATENSTAIHAPQVGDIDRLTVETVLPDGTRVKEGDVVLTFDRGTVEDEVRQYKAEHDIAKAEYERTARDLEKQRIELQLAVKRADLKVEQAKLFVVEGVNLISKVELEKAKLDVKKAENDLALARQALAQFSKKKEAALKVVELKREQAAEKVEKLESQLDLTTLRAPKDGVIFGPVTRLNWNRAKVEPGRVVRNGDKLLELPDFSSFVAKVYVRQQDARWIAKGQKATVVAAVMPEGKLTGTVLKKADFSGTWNERVGMEIPEGMVKEVLVEILLDQAPPQLRPGGSVRVHIEAELESKGVTVPLAAIHDEEDGTRYVVLESGNKQVVEVGATSTSSAAVLSGLSAGDKVRIELPDAKDNAKTDSKAGEEEDKPKRGGKPPSRPRKRRRRR